MCGCDLIYENEKTGNEVYMELSSRSFFVWNDGYVVGFYGSFVMAKEIADKNWQHEDYSTRYYMY